MELRFQCRLNFHANMTLRDELQTVWQAFIDASMEQMTRLRVAVVFFRDIDQVDIRSSARFRQIGSSSQAVTLECFPLQYIEDLGRMEREIISCGRVGDLEPYMKRRDQLLEELGRTIRLGKLLRSRAADPIIPGGK